jgi:2,4-dienoyl-CoA reductase-like NADH-dependent reductase (Old Yellow Enzyme family)
MSKLFAPFKIRNVEFRNRIFVSPMCQYSADDGIPNDWHFVHLCSRSVGGAGLVMVEATAVSPEGRITINDLGIWNEKQLDAFKRITSFIESNGAVPGIQLAHAGRKASTSPPWKGGIYVEIKDGGWETIAPSPIAFDKGYAIPHEMTIDEIEMLVKNFVFAAEKAQKAGFRIIEIHMAHGYLLHQFLSPVSNLRKDQYGGNIEGRMNLPLRVAKAVRKVWPESLPVFVRISASDWLDEGWDIEQSIQLAKELGKIGIDLIDCSSGGIVSYAKIPAGPGYQVPFSAAIRKATGIATGAVGLILAAQQAEQILVCNEADVVFLAREMLRDPYWPIHAAKELGSDVKWPVQYERAKR